MTSRETQVLRVVEEIWIEAPPGRVFRALTDPDEITAWWTVPEAYATTDARIDLREGGSYHLSGWSRGRGAFEVHGVYQIVDPPHRLAYTWVPDWDPDAVHSRVEFQLAERDGGTHLSVVHTGFLTPTSRDEHAGGWPAVLTALARHAAA